NTASRCDNRRAEKCAGGECRCHGAGGSAKNFSAYCRDAGENRGRARGESERDQHQGDDERRTRGHRAQRRDGGNRGGECGGTMIVIPSEAKRSRGIPVRYLYASRRDPSTLLGMTILRV